MIVYRQKEYGLKKWFDKLRIKLHKLTPGFMRADKMDDISGDEERERRIENASGLGTMAGGLISGSTLGIIPSGGLLFDYKVGEGLRKARHKTRNFLRNYSDSIENHYQRRYDRRAVANGEMTEDEYFDKWNIK